MRQKLYLVAAFCLLSGSIAFAQRKPDASVQFKQKIDNILLDDVSGNVIVKEKDAVQSYNPETGKIDWRVTDEELSKGNAVGDAIGIADAALSADIGKLLESKKDLIYFIPRSPYVSLTIDDKDVIINAEDGKVMLNTHNMDFRILKSQFLPNDNAFLLTIISNKHYGMVYYDLNIGSQKWQTELAKKESFLKSMGSMFSLIPQQGEDEAISEGNNIYASVNGILYKLQKTDGKLLWNTNDKITMFYLTQNKDRVIVVNSSKKLLSVKSRMNILDAETGNKIWKDDIETKFLSYVEDWPDKILVAHAGGFNFYSYADGKKIWKKDAKGNSIKKVIPVGNDYLYVADREMNLIDRNGQSLWKKFVEICDKDEDQVYYLGKVDNNRVLYITDAYGNMVDYTSGKKIWKKNIEFEQKKPLLYSYDEGHKVFMVYNDKRLYKFDPNASRDDRPDEFARMKEIKEDKSMSDIELFDWGVSLVGQSDVIGVTNNGQVKYHNTYKEPGGSSRKLLKGAGSMLGFGGSASTSLANAQLVIESRDANGNPVAWSGDLFDKKTKNTMSGAGSLASSAGSALFEKNKERFNAMKSNNEYAFLINRNDAGGKELVKVRKSDGVEVDKIAIDENKPLYEVDAVTDNVYYATDNELRIYSKK